MLNISRRPRIGRSSSNDPSRHRLAARLMPLSSSAVNLPSNITEHQDEAQGLAG